MPEKFLTLASQEQFIFSPIFTPGAVTFISWPSPPFAIVQLLSSAQVQVISAAIATADTINSTDRVNRTKVRKVS
jgi:hypothetical protein